MMRFISIIIMTIVICVAILINFPFVTLNSLISRMCKSHWRFRWYLQAVGPPHGRQRQSKHVWNWNVTCLKSTAQDTNPAHATRPPSSPKHNPKQSPTGPSEGPEHAKKSQNRAPKGLQEDQQGSKTELKKASERLEWTKTSFSKNLQKQLSFNGFWMVLAAEMASKSFRNALESLDLASTTRKINDTTQDTHPKRHQRTQKRKNLQKPLKNQGFLRFLRNHGVWDLDSTGTESAF